MSKTAQTAVSARDAGIQPGDEVEFRKSCLCTDSAAARMFTEMAGPAVRHVPGWGWVHWDGRRWKRDHEGRVRAIAMGVGERIRDLALAYHEAREPAKLVSWLLTHARKCESARTIRDFMSLAEPGLHATVETFDRDPLLVNFRNCTLDLKAIEGRPLGSALV